MYNATHTNTHIVACVYVCDCVGESCVCDHVGSSSPRKIKSGVLIIVSNKQQAIKTDMLLVHALYSMFVCVGACGRTCGGVDTGCVCVCGCVSTQVKPKCT